MSPEQVAGHAVDHRTDLYSLGVVGYTMLAGRLPFEGRETAEVLAKQLTADPPPLRSLAPTVSDATVSVVNRCLAKDAGERWQDACSLARALETSEDRRLPDALQGVEGQGLPGLVIATAYLGILARTEPPPVILLLNAALLLATYFSVLVRLHREGFPIGLAQRTIWTEPSWWLFAYPAPLRRTGSVWPRLPRAVRRLRTWIPLLVVLLFLSLLGVKENLGITLGLVFAPLVAFDVLRLLAFRELDRRGLAKADRARVALSVPPGRGSFWSQEHVAAVLDPDPAREHARRLETPHDRLRSILRHGDALQGQLRPVGARAAVAARRLLAEIDSDDAELAALGGELEPGEDARLAARIEALADAESRSEAAEMRKLLERQLDLVRGLDERLRATEARRQRRVELLRNLDLELALLASTERRPEEASSASGRVRRLCEAIAAQTDAVRSDAALDADSQLPTLDASQSSDPTSSRIPTQPLGPT